MRLWQAGRQWHRIANEKQVNCFLFVYLFIVVMVGPLRCDGVVTCVLHYRGSLVFGCVCVWLRAHCRASYIYNMRSRYTLNKPGSPAQKWKWTSLFAVGCSLLLLLLLLIFVPFGFGNLCSLYFTLRVWLNVNALLLLLLLMLFTCLYIECTRLLLLCVYARTGCNAVRPYSQRS